MFNLSQTNVIIIVTVILVFLIIFFIFDKQHNIELFTSSSQKLNVLDKQFTTSSATDLKGLTIDTLECDKSCCGNQDYVSFDQLTPNEISDRIASLNTDSGPYVRTNYTCGNGINGVGCPCISKKAYLHLANRGQPFRKYEYDTIEPTLSVGSNIHRFKNYMSVDEHKQGLKSMFADSPKMNDHILQRRPETTL